VNNGVESPVRNPGKRTLKSFVRNLLVAGVLLVAGGCASPNVNPASARHGMGYVDFYATDADNLYWDVTDLKQNKKVFYKFDPLGEPILRLAFKPGQYELKINFLNHVIATPGTAEVDVQEGMITPVIVTLLPAGEALYRTKRTAAGSTYYGTYGRRTSIHDNPATSYEVALDPQPPLPYQRKEQMSYAHPPAQ
jgi:hypothetical protein